MSPPDDFLGNLLLTFVVLGTVPIFAMAWQFLAVPLHSFKNNYRTASPYLPNVAVMIPAWNEGAVICPSVERLLHLEYPEDGLRVYVIDDASTDNTPELMAEMMEKYPGRVFHLRREKGGEGKAHTLNFGLRHIIQEDWFEAVLIMDADVIYSPTSLRRMTRHLADPTVGAVTAYIREGTPHPSFLTRFIGLEYILAQAASRRAQNVFRAIACLAGGAQLHSKENLLEIGGAINTETFAEDTVTTFKTQLSGRRVVFEPYATVIAEEPARVNALWKQRLRWARGNVQVTKMFKGVWLRKSSRHKLGDFSFALFWFSLFLLPVAMLLSTIGLVGLYFLDYEFAVLTFRTTWVLASCTYVYSMILALQIDPEVGKRTWREAMLFPGFVSVLVMFSAVFPGVLERELPRALGITIPEVVTSWWTLFTYSWVTVSMAAAWLVKTLDNTRVGRFFSPLLTYFVGYGPLLCAITMDSYWKEWKKTELKWDKTEKTGRMIG